MDVAQDLFVSTEPDRPWDTMYVVENELMICMTGLSNQLGKSGCTSAILDAIAGHTGQARPWMDRV